VDVQKLSMYALRIAYGKSARDDEMIDAYLQRRHEASVKKESKIERR
jgi:hypothetical protein